MKGEANALRALAGRFGRVSYVDAQVGKIIAALEYCRLAGDIQVLYTTDDGDNNGARPEVQEHFL